MAPFLENLGLDFFAEDEEDIVRLFSLVAQEGTPIAGYGNTIYMNYNFGDAQLIAREVVNDADEQIEIVGLDTHSRGSCVWDVRLSGINITPKDADAAQRYCVLKRAEDGSGMVAAQIVNADVLPSFLEDDLIKLQMVGFGVDFHYFADEDEYAASCAELRDGKKLMLSDGTIMPMGFMLNHNPDHDESEKNDDLDTCVLLRGTVKKLYWGLLDFEGNEEKGYIRCYIDTQYGELELIHTLEQVEESERNNFKIGSIISGIFVLSGDAGIYEYGKGAIFDEEHNLRLLRHIFVKGEASRAFRAFAEDAIYASAASGKELSGKKQIIEFLQYVHDVYLDKKDKYRAYMATIISIDYYGGAPPKYPFGKRCVVLALDGSDNYESIAFIDIDENGRITELTLSVDPRYHFKIDVAPKKPSVFDDIKPLENVAEALINRARFQGFVDDTVEDETITDNLSEYRSYKFNAEWMLEALVSDDTADDKERALSNVFGYLFAKETEHFVNKTRFTGNAGLLINYEFADALDGEIHSRLSPDEHSALTEVMKRASQFYSDYKHYRLFLKEDATTDVAEEDDLLRALIVVQRIGYLFGEKFLKKISTKGDSTLP
jgi:hypothetical protein